jgi:hypothetical protein
LSSLGGIALTRSAIFRYGPMAYSCYNVIPQSTRRIYIVASVSHPPCKVLLEDLQRHLQSLHPAAEIIVSSKSVEEDFSALSRAPILIKHGQSTFSLWAGLAGNNRVYSMPLPSAYALDTTPDLGANWTWRACAQLEPGEAQSKNIKALSDILLWVKSN